jgi:hypothetical protein
MPTPPLPPLEPVDLFLAVDEAPAEPMPQYRQLWSAQVNEEAIRQPAAVIRLNGPGMPAIEVRQLRWSPRSGYIELYNKDDPNRPIVVPDPNARPEDFSWHWYGKAGYTTVSLTVERGVLAGRVWLRDKRYALRPSGAGLLLGQTNSNYWQLHPETGLGESLSSARAVSPGGPMNNFASPAGTWDHSCSGPLPSGYHVVDVLVLYTPGILSAYGSAAGVEAKIRIEVDDANNALMRSGINSISYHLAGIEFLPSSGFYDTSDIVQGLQTLSGVVPTGSPPYCQLSDNTDVLGRRNSLHADIVALARRDQTGQGTCGYSFIQRRQMGFCEHEAGPTFERYAYMIFDPECGADAQNFAHELGHQLGADHDPGNYSGSGFIQSCPWSYGHRSDDSAYGFRTVMAYPTANQTGIPAPDCQSEADCPLIDAFSTPELEWTGSALQPTPVPPAPPQGLPIGLSPPPPNGWQPAHVADTLRRLGPVSAAFRQRPDSVFVNGFQ